MNSHRALALLVCSILLLSQSPGASGVATSAQERANFARRAVQRDHFLERGYALGLERARAKRAELDARFGRALAIPPDAEADPSLGSAKGRSGALGKTRDSDWTAYGGPFGMPEAAHLLRRGMIGPRVDEMQAAAASGPNAAVSGLLAPRALPPPPGDWALEPLPDMSGWTQQMVDSLVTLYFTRDELLKLWWAQAILAEDPGISEAMTLFWHDHFATSYEKVLFPQSMYKQNQLFRQYAVGNFKTLVHQIALDPAMLIWLDGNDNYVNHINENFARELLELFTMGLDHYTQEDVVAAARAFTGTFSFDGVNTVQIPEYHDDGLKTFMGQTGNWDGDDIIEIIFQQDETARFLCRKLYRWFIDEYPDEARVEELAQTLRAFNYQLEPVLSRMFKSDLFFDPNYRGALYCDGIDRSIGLLRAFYIDTVDYTDPTGPQAYWTWDAMILQRHVLFQPPNVGGWLGYRAWLNSYILPWRRTLDVSLVDGDLWGWDLMMKLDGVALANRLSDPNNPVTMVNDLTTCFYGVPPGPAVRQRLLDELLQGMDPGDWSMNNPFAEQHIESLMRLLIRMPDFQLK